MPVVVLLLMKVVVGAIREAVHKMRAAKPQPLCVECFYAHVQYGANGRLAISCTYGGIVRPITLDVLYCSDYRNRNVQPNLVRIGFAPDVQGAQAP
jgi:hypothetical protein